MMGVRVDMTPQAARTMPTRCTVMPPIVCAYGHCAAYPY
jgi:hypothetical protein